MGGEVESDGHSWRIRIAASTLVAPLILAPSITTAAMFWARYQSELMHPAASARIPPTVSRAISDHNIGDVFANWILGFAVNNEAWHFSVARWANREDRKTPTSEGFRAEEW